MGMAILFGLLVGLSALTVGGLYFIQSRHVYAGLIFTAVFCCIIYGLMAQTQTSMGRLMKGLFLWSTLIFILGYLVEPFGGGTSKTPATMSYHLLTSGMASSMFLFLMILLDDLKLKRGYGLLRVAGRNSLLAYIMGEHLVIPILYLMGLMYPIHKAIQNSVTLGTLWGAILTILILFVVAIFTRYKIYVRV
jgi:predicted acyltransferase